MPLLGLFLGFWPKNDPFQQKSKIGLRYTSSFFPSFHMMPKSLFYDSPKYALGGHPRGSHVVENQKRSKLMRWHLVQLEVGKKIFWILTSLYPTPPPPEVSKMAIFEGFSICPTKSDIMTDTVNIEIKTQRFFLPTCRPKKSVKWGFPIFSF